LRSIGLVFKLIKGRKKYSFKSSFYFAVCSDKAGLKLEQKKIFIGGAKVFWSPAKYTCLLVFIDGLFWQQLTLIIYKLRFKPL
jgi:hypothetical protein